MMFRGKVRQIHFVGIGGSGMSGIAEVLLNLGYEISGSDLSEGAAVRRLRDMGAKVAIGHSAENLGEADVVVKSTAVAMSNAEIQEALQSGVPVIRRAEMLAELMRLKHGLAVAGTHGKTTTTSMLAKVMAAAGVDPTVIIGGRLDSLGSNARLGGGDYLVAEADESDGTFLLLSPTVALITNVDPEHLEHYGTLSALEDTFVDFANKVPFYGFAVVCLDHPGVQKILPRMERRVVTYGVSPQATYRAQDMHYQGCESRFTVAAGEEVLGEITLHMPGEHNVLNALATVATGLELEVPFAQIREGLDGFGGVDRRFSLRGEKDGVLVVDDYGHHPVEIEATLGAASEGYASRRIVAVFQPHRYTRARDLSEDFHHAFHRAHHVVVLPIHAAGEEPIDGVDHHTLAAGMRAAGHRSVVTVESLEEAAAHLREFQVSGDLVITLGAGSVNRVCTLLLEETA